MSQRRSPAMSILRFISIALISIALVLSLLLIFQRIFSPFQVIKSNSMFPQIKTGDAVVMKDVDPGAVQVGQVIIFEDPDRDGQYVIHRVVAIEDKGYAKYFTTKGDNNPEIDPERVTTGEVVGGMAAKLPRFGVFLDFLSSPRGYITCIAIPAAASLLLVFILSIIERTAAHRARKRDVFRPMPTSGD